jgi:hypothetical protein
MEAYVCPKCKTFIYPKQELRPAESVEFTQVERLTRERDEALLACAGMREALEAAQKVLLEPDEGGWPIGTCPLKDVDTACTCEEPCDEVRAVTLVEKALSSTSLGSSMLQRVKGLEQRAKDLGGFLDDCVDELKETRALLRELLANVYEKREDGSEQRSGPPSLQLCRRVDAYLKGGAVNG